ncbi:MAG: hypothetical protein AVDCRST_MAG75-1571 [uncultured Propionibacteriaceae bacterium]|uniref:PknH-like extracellular domain-containing protein n=1 Tax=uncultured Propionibacteriaceae bacterium TaxID=257457 RepID=A0A6J4NTH2_9ACTN|nr:MAG: hypothetical protein AVDCRST_MAG75-1571 [uncultured Propionibacteriaceae bacterium]
MTEPAPDDADGSAGRPGGHARVASSHQLLVADHHGPWVDELTLGPRPGLRRRRRVLAVLAVALVAAITGWLGVQAVSPILSDEQLRSSYEPAPPGVDDWNMSAMRPPPTRLLGTTAALDSPACRDSAAALFNYLPPGSLSGYGATFQYSASERWGVSSTARYRDRQAAAAGWAAMISSLNSCGPFTLPARYGQVAVTVTATTVSDGWLGGDQAGYQVVTSSGSADQTSMLTGLRFGNTVSWQTTSTELDRTVSSGDAQLELDALLSRLRAVARNW